MRKQYILHIVVILLSIINVINFNNASALSYSSEVGVGFTFNPTLSVSLSSRDLTIQELPLGTTGTSNEVNVLVRSNAAYGYTLSATVGNNSTYNSDSLINNIDNNKVFSNIAVDADLSSLNDSTSTNIWGYSYKDNTVDNPTWSNYNGLSLYSSTNPTTLIDLNSNTTTGTSSLDFKIAAKASNTQPSGEYSNIINFMAVSKVGTVSLLDAFVASNATMQNGYYTMQGMTPAICNAATIGSSLQLLDVRDGKLYWVTKLADNNCWMTQNLDLDLSSTVALTSETSDIDPESYGKTIYTAETGYSKDNNTGIVSWSPSTIDSGGVQRADTIEMVWSSNTAATVPGWTNDYNNPYSADPGEKYRYTNPTSYNEATYTSLESCANTNNNDIAGCQHTHFGNYYNWSAAVASNNTSSALSGSIQANSVCPKNWNLPADGVYTVLMTIQKVYKSYTSYATDGFNKLRTAPLYFQRFGVINNRSLSNLGVNGAYWANKVNNDTTSYDLDFSGTGIWPNNNGPNYGNRYFGSSIRCMTGSS